MGAAYCDAFYQTKRRLEYLTFVPESKANFSVVCDINYLTAINTNGGGGKAPGNREPSTKY